MVQDAMWIISQNMLHVRHESSLKEPKECDFHLCFHTFHLLTVFTVPFLISCRLKSQFAAAVKPWHNVTGYYHPKTINNNICHLCQRVISYISIVMRLLTQAVPSSSGLCQKHQVHQAVGHRLALQPKMLFLGHSGWNIQTLFPVGCCASSCRATPSIMLTVFCLNRGWRGS